MSKWKSMAALSLCLVLLGLHISFLSANAVVQSSQTQNVTTMSAEFDRWYHNYTSLSQAFVYQYVHNHTENTVIVLRTALLIAENETYKEALFPVQVVAKQQLHVGSWKLPLDVAYGHKYTDVSQSLCSSGQRLNTSLPITVEISTFSPEPVLFYVRADVLHNFTLSLGKEYEVVVSPSSPTYYQYTFEPGVKRWHTLNVESEGEGGDYCAFVSVQPAKCPVLDLVRDIREGGVYQTFLNQTALTFESMQDTDSVYIVFVVTPTDFTCQKLDKDSSHNKAKIKHIKFRIEQQVEDTVYIYAVLAAIGYCAAFYIAFIAVVIFMTIRDRRKKGPSDAEIQERIEEMKPAMTSAANNPSYGTGEETEAATPQGASGDNSQVSKRRTGSDASDAGHDVDMLEDIDEHKDVYRMKHDSNLETNVDVAMDDLTSHNEQVERKNLTVADMTKKGDHFLSKKYTLYKWNIITFSIFYALPVVQLVFTYQLYLNASGNQDICYYNFKCSRRLGALHNFNNVISNIGYILLGILFIIVVYRRRLKLKNLPEHIREKCGIPAHYGLYYAMGWALCIEGIMSGSYHVCPSYTNFQFDTAFMYILGGLLILRIFQSRHSDINVNSHVAYLSLASLIGISVFGMLYNHPIFWGFFVAAYLLIIFYLSLQVYYVGRFRLNKTLFASIKNYIKTDCCRWHKPLYRARLVLLILMNAINWALAIYGVVTEPPDYASYLLSIVIANLMGYTIFYIIMKLVKKEKIRPTSIIHMIIAAILWGFALYFFNQHLYSWRYTPAQSRTYNEDCILLDFFDGHDVWHLLSAGALFSSFLVVFYIDDDLFETPREKISVF